MDRLSDHNLDPLAEPQVFGARERDGNDRHAGLERERREPLREGQQLAPLRSVIALGKDRHRAADLERPAHMPEKRLVSVSLANDRHEAAGLPDDPPLHLARDQDGWVCKEVDARLNRKQEEERELVQPVEVVGDDNVVAGMRDVLLPHHVEAEDEPQQWHPDEPDRAASEGRRAAHRKEVSWWEFGLSHRGWPGG